MRFGSAFLLGALLAASGCTTTPTDPALQNAGPRPANTRELVMAWLQNDRRFAKFSDITISEVRQGGQWTGLANQGKVPTWYVCLDFKRKELLRGKVRDGPYIVWIRDNKVLYATHWVDDDFSDHECKR